MKRLIISSERLLPWVGVSGASYQLLSPLTPTENIFSTKTITPSDIMYFQKNESDAPMTIKRITYYVNDKVAGLIGLCSLLCNIYEDE